MSTPFAPWVAGSVVPKFYQTPPPRQSVHLQVVPSACECDDTDYGIDDTDFRPQRNYEGFLVVIIKAMLVLILFCSVALVGLGIGFALKGGEVQGIVVQPGDSLYSISARLPNAPSPAQVAADIRSLNALESDNLQVGQTLILPEY